MMLKIQRLKRIQIESRFMREYTRICKRLIESSRMKFNPNQLRKMIFTIKKNEDATTSFKEKTLKMSQIKKKDNY